MIPLLLFHMVLLMVGTAQPRPEVIYTGNDKLQMNGAKFRKSGYGLNTEIESEASNSLPKSQKFQMADSNDDKVPTYFYKPECQRAPNNGNCEDNKEKQDQTDVYAEIDGDSIYQPPHKVFSEDEINVDHQIPHCPEETEGSSIIVVATMDGDIIGMEESTGKPMWNYRLDLVKPELVSSSRTQIYVTSKNTWCDIVPSLDGHLYLFDGENYEATGYNTEKLLTSSHRFSEENMLTGSSTRYVVGIVPETGRVLYTCENGVCHRFPQTPTPWTLILSRQTTTINSIDPKNGESRWNMTIGEPDVHIAGGACLSSVMSSEDQLSFKFTAHEGIVAAYRDSAMKWTKKTKSAIAYAWLVCDGRVSKLDISNDASGTSLIQPLKDFSAATAGSHNGIPYLIKSPTIAGFPELSSEQRIRTYPLELSTEVLGIGGVRRIEAPKNQEVARNNSMWDSMRFFMGNPAFEKASMQVYVSLFIACCTALYFLGKKSGYRPLLDGRTSQLFINLFDWLGIDRSKVFPDKARMSDVPAPAEEIPTPPQERVRLVSRTSECESRVVQEFNCKEVLGQGGFAAVFRMEHKTDLGQYAVKRIPPAKRYSQDRVLREARAMAQLSHPHIVRYYSCWEENCTDEWIEEYDKKNNVKLDSLDEGSTSSDDEEESSSLIQKDNSEESSEESSYPGFQLQSSSSWNQTGGNESSSLQLSQEASSDDSDFSESASRLSISNRRPSKKIIDMPEDEDSIVFERSSRGIFEQNEYSDSIVFEETSAKSPLHSKFPETVPEEDESGSSANSQPRESRAGRFCCSGDKPMDIIRTYVYIQLELCQKDTLHDYLLKNPDRDVKEMKYLFNNIVSAVEFIHDKKFIHRDLKPTNILFSSDGIIKIGDFGLVTDPDNASNHPSSQDLGSKKHRTKGCGTFIYMAPEMNISKNYDHKVDIYALGIILIEMLQYFTTGNERASVLKRARSGVLSADFQDKFPEEADLVEEMLHQNPACRPTTRGIRASLPFRDYQSVQDLSKITEQSMYVLQYQQ